MEKPLQIPDDPTLSTSRPVRLYKVDEEVLMRIHDAIKKNTHTGLHDLIRDAIHAGLPAVVERWRPMVEKNKG